VYLSFSHTHCENFFPTFDLLSQSTTKKNQNFAQTKKYEQQKIEFFCQMWKQEENNIRAKDIKPFTSATVF